MGRAVELPDIHNVAFVLQNGRFIIVYVEIIGSGEYGHYRRKACCLRLSIHAISALSIQKAEQLRKENISPRILSLVGSDNRQQIVAFKELTCGLVSVREGS